MQELAQKFGELCTEFQAQAYIIITISCFFIGLTLSLSEDGAEKLKKRIIYIILGWLLICGAITLGAKYGSSLKF